ncbi:MAG: hypothetical protein EBU75_01430 [Betaproteobacteria bacterium]|nr:hypothetical protein [Betaproteobacteria bacterium]
MRAPLSLSLQHLSADLERLLQKHLNLRPMGWRRYNFTTRDQSTSDELMTAFSQPFTGQAAAAPHTAAGDRYLALAARAPA